MQEQPIPLATFLSALRRRFKSFIHWAAHSKRFRGVYAWVCLLVLAGTTGLWAAWGASLQGNNADQLVDPYLFTNGHTFHGAYFPGAHTFLIKWPIFWLVQRVGITSLSLRVATVAVVVATVLAIAWLLYRIIRRPLVFGTVCLGLSLALLLVPAQPYAGGLLPVNMAMLTTRNLEYVLYLLALVCFVRARRLRSWAFIGGVAALSLLAASDKLFLTLSAGGALLALVTYALVSNRAQSAFAARWLAGTVLAGITSTLLLAGLSATHVTHIVNDTAANPYGLATGAKPLALGSAYAVLHLFTNTGANPAYDNRILSQLPSNLWHELFSWRGPAYVVALLLTLYALLMVWRVMWPTRQTTARRDDLPPRATVLAISLVWSSVAALAVFIVTNHYYAVDARYLTICLLALVVAVSVQLRTRQWRWPEDMLYIACGLSITIGLAALTSYHVTHKQQLALQDTAARNQTVAAILRRHHVDTLVGDYWRVLPIKLASRDTQAVTPLTGCAQPAGTLTSSAWEPDLTKHSFAYLVTFGGSLTNFPVCSLTDITAKYGRPQSTQIIAGTLAQPKEALLFYDLGARRPAASIQITSQASIAPVPLHELPKVSCDGQTVVNVVAHQDDDILFMNPNLLHDIQAGKCVRTIYLTAGDAGADRLYWISRQLGSQAAYSSMLGLEKGVWTQQSVRLDAGEYATVATLEGNDKISLVFIGLPDGNLQGQGFRGTDNQSLAQLFDGKLGSMRSVDGQSTYTAQQLVAALSNLMTIYDPAVINTQADVASGSYPDHSDHVAAGKFTRQAALAYEQQHFGEGVTIPLIRYIGYPVHGYAANVDGDELIQKEQAFLAYAQYDGGVCHTIGQCARTPTYGAYLQRQYTENDAR